MTSSLDPVQSTLCDEEKFKDFSDTDSPSLSLTSYQSRSRLYRHLIIALSILIFLIPTTYFTLSKWPTSHPEFEQCGTTSIEARARGCVFETTSFTWLPTTCYDPITEDEFLAYVAANNMKYYRHNNYSEEVSIEEVRRGDGEGYYVRQPYHLTHCLFLIKKLHRALDAGKKVDGYIKPVPHTEHCVDMLSKPAGYRKDDIQLSFVKWPYCGRPGGYNVHWEALGQWTDY